MEKMLKLLSGITGIITMIGSALAVRFWVPTIFILSLLKLVNLVQIPWFAGVFSISAVGTGLWMLFLGLIFIFVGFILVSFMTI